jgi:hypothetical protein
MQPEDTSVCNLKVLVYAALSCYCLRPEATGLKLAVYEAFC